MGSRNHSRMRPSQRSRMSNEAHMSKGGSAARTRSQLMAPTRRATPPREELRGRKPRELLGRGT
eukprot:4036681-Pyramimonas_sp.AAC.1